MPRVLPDRAVNVNCGPYFATLEDVNADYDKLQAHNFYFSDPLWNRDFYYTLESVLPAELIPTGN